MESYHPIFFVVGLVAPSGLVPHINSVDNLIFEIICKIGDVICKVFLKFVFNVSQEIVLNLFRIAQEIIYHIFNIVKIIVENV